MLAPERRLALFLTGAEGRLGRLLAAAWAARPPAGPAPVWSARRPGREGVLGWDLLAGPAPAALAGAGVLVNLAGVTAAPRAGANAALACAALDAAAAAGVGHVFLFSSAAVYGPVPAGAAAEDAPPAPGSAYGADKLAMEAAALDWRRAAGPGAPGVTLLRLGNVAGADALAAGLARGGPVALDDVGPPGAPRGPVRSYIGPATLARVLAALAALAVQGRALPQLLNLAAPAPVAMEALLAAAGAPWRFVPAPPGAVARVVLDTARLQALAPVLPQEGTAAAMMAEVAALAGARGRP